MQEIKRRMTVVDLILDRRINTGFAITNAELLAVQLRKVAELIALSAICSHRDEYQKLRTRFESDWNARLILKDVARINPEFYPYPSTQIKDRATGQIKRVERIEDGWLTQDGLIAMVDACSNVLHAFNPYQTDLPDLTQFNSDCREWRSEIYTLLSHHHVQILDRDEQWWVVMQAESDGNVHVYEFQTVREDKADP